MEIASVSFGYRSRMGSCSSRGREALLQISEASLNQPHDPGPHQNVRLTVSHVLHAPLDNGAAALRPDFERSGVMGREKPGDLAITMESLCVVDRLETLDDFLAVARLDRTEMTYPCAGQADTCDQWMPVEVERSDQRPHRVRRCRKLNGFGHGLHLRVRRREIRKHLHAGLRRSGRAALEELPIAVDEPGEQDVNRVSIDRAASSRLVGPAVERALLD